MGNLAKIEQNWKSLCTDTMFKIPTDHPVVCMEHKQTKERAYFNIKLNRLVANNRHMARIVAKKMAKKGIFMKYIVLIMCLLIDVNVYAADMPAVGKDHCGGCHAVEKKLYAPSFRDIAIKYRDDVDAVNKLTEHINSGGMFGWNMGIRMPAKGLGAGDREIKGMVEFIASLSIADSSSK